MASKLSTPTTKETKNMTPQRLKAYQKDFTLLYTNWPSTIKFLIKSFVQERIQDERATSST